MFLNKFYLYQTAYFDIFLYIFSVESLKFVKNGKIDLGRFREKV